MSHVVSDREGGYVALVPLGAGQLVTLASISPPLRLRRYREERRSGLRLVLAVNFWCLLFECGALIIAQAARL